LVAKLTHRWQVTLTAKRDEFDRTTALCQLIYPEIFIQIKSSQKANGQAVYRDSSQVTFIGSPIPLSLNPP